MTCGDTCFLASGVHGRLFRAGDAGAWHRIIVALALLLMASVSAAGGDDHRVVFELTSDQAKAWESLLTNAENLRSALPSTTIEIVAHGPGLSMLVEESNAAVRKRMAGLAENGIVFAACENTMRRKGVAREALSSFVTTVDAGVAELVRKQEAGWSYIRSGG